MRLSFFLPMIAAFAPSAIAEDWQDRIETDITAEAVLVLAPTQNETDGLPDGERGLYEFGLTGGAETVLDNGTIIGARLALRLQRDHPARPAGRGTLRGGATGPSGLTSGLGPGPEPLDAGPRGQLERAYIYIEGGYGEISLGRDLGMAARVFEGDVGALSHAGLANTRLDTTGLAVLSTRSDLTGPSTKISYATPRYLGGFLGASYTPDADVRGLDRDATGSTGLGFAGLKNVFEIGANLSRRLPGSEIRVRAGLSYAVADIDSPAGFAAVFSDGVEDWSAGVEIEREDWRFGASWRGADEGIVGAGDYSGWTIGLAHERGDWTGSLVYGEAEIGALEADSRGVSIELQRTVNDLLSVGIAWQSRRLDSLPVAGAPGDGEFDRQSLVVEITLLWENATFSDY